MPHTETTLTSKEIFNGHVIRVTYDTVRLENGDTSFREVVHHHGGACVLAVTRQVPWFVGRPYRYALGEELWELPAGKLEAGEDPFKAAKRELAEECGVTAGQYTDLGVIYPTVGYDSEKIYMWAATDLQRTGQHLDPDEFLDVVEMPFDTVLDMVLRGEIKDSKTVAAVLKFALLRRR